MTKIKYGKNIVLTEAYNESLTQLRNLIERIDRIRVNASDTCEEQFDEWHKLSINAGSLNSNLKSALIYALEAAEEN